MFYAENINKDAARLNITGGTAFPEVATFSHRLGTGLGGDVGESYHGDGLVRLKPDHARTTPDVMAAVRTAVERDVPSVTAQLMEDLTGDLTAVPQPIEIKLYATDAETVCHGRGAYARDEDGDGFCGAHVNTMEGFWRCCAPGCDRIAASRRTNCRSTAASSSWCTARAGAAKPCSAPSLLGWWRDVSTATLESDKSLSSDRIVTVLFAY